MSYNYQKRAYKAFALRWDGSNTSDILKLFTEATKYGEEAIMVRWQDPVSHKCGISTISIGDWCVVGEDGKTRIYTDTRMKTLYRPIDK